MRFWTMLIQYAVADFFATLTSIKWVRGDGSRWAFVSFLCYALCSLVWLVGFGSKDSPGATRALAIYPIVAAFTGVMTSWVIVGDKLTARDLVAMALGLVSVVLLSTGKPE